MKTTKDFKRFLSELMLGIFMVTTINPVPAIANLTSDKVIYPLKQISKLECRFNDFADLSSDCKQDLPVLNTRDYSKYATLNWGYNDYTRLYSVLWWASYKYWWDVWNGGHIWTDIATAKWTPVYTIADWKVINARNDVMEWNFISIEHSIKWKKIVSSYMHLSKMEVKVWDIITVWTKIWEVWATWNATWNHLHIQIDLDTTKSYPYYYDYNACPYSYYKITEEWICFNELAKNSIDPLLFLETAWAILDSYTPTSVSVTNPTTNNNSNTPTNNTNDLSIFDRTVYIWYSEADIKKVQEIYQNIWVYKWAITWKYEDIEDSIFQYQVSKWILANKSDNWAGWFGPKTRSTTKQDYMEYLASWNQNTWTQNNWNQSNNVQVVYDTKIETQKIEKVNLMTREEIEKREVEEFLKFHKIELNLINKWWNIQKNGSETLKLNITNRKWVAFKWEMPGWMTFVVNTEKVSIFPEKLFYFTDWKRDITITWIKEGDTNLYVKIWNEVIKTIPLKVYNSNISMYPASSKILAANSTILWWKQTWVVIFKDNTNRNMINLKFWSTYNIKASGDNKICIKQWSIKNVKKIYTATCDDSDFKNEANFTYDNTVWWLLIFDYKATSKDFNIVIKNNFDNKVLSEKKFLVSNPKWLANTYEYKNEVLSMLEQWIADWVNKWYFLENRWLSQKDALTWIENALTKIQKKVYDNQTNTIIKNSLNDIKIAKQTASKSKTITRLDLLNLSYKYLVLNTEWNGKKTYKDIDDTTSKKLAKIFDEQTTWKDQFGQSYFRPDTEITRWEWAYLLSNTLVKNAQAYLTLK